MTDKTFNIKLVGGSRELKFNNRALYEFSVVHGRDPIHVFARGEMGIRAITHFVWAGLLHSDPNITLDEVKDLVPLNDLQSVVDVVVAAMEHATDTGGKGGDSPKKKADTPQ